MTTSETTCFCYDGYHYMGYVITLPDGEEDIEYERVACRRCQEEDGK